MSRKRPRSSVDHGPSLKRTRRRKSSLKLEDLPAEIVDIILSHVIEVPDKYYHAHKSAFSMNTSFLAPIAQTSRWFRQRLNDHLRKECLWIKLKIVRWDDLDRSIGIEQGLPVLPYFLWAKLQPLPAVLELELSGPGGRNEQATPQTVCLHEAVNTFVFPFNFDSFHRLCHRIRSESAEGYLDTLVVHYCPITVVSRRHLDYAVMLALLTFIDITEIQFDVPEKLKPSQDMIFTNGSPMRASDVLKMAKAALAAADKFEAQGHHAEAGLQLLYSFWTIELANMFLPGPHDWNSGEQEDDVDIGDTFLGDAPPARNVIGNQLRQSIHQIEYRACLAHTQFYETHGSSWVVDHESVFGRQEQRWIDDPNFTWFGLYPFELAQVHHARAMAARVFMRIGARFRVESRTADGTPTWCTSILSRFHKPELNKITIQEMALACWLQGDNAEFARQYKSMTAGLEEQVVLFDNVSPRRYIQGAVGGGEIWRGDWWMYLEWVEHPDGNEDSDFMSYLTLARKGVEDPATTSIRQLHETVL